MFSFIFWVWHACVEHIGEGEYECASDFGQFAHFQVACIELAIFDTHANVYQTIIHAVNSIGGGF